METEDYVIGFVMAAFLFVGGCAAGVGFTDGKVMAVRKEAVKRGYAEFVTDGSTVSFKWLEKE